VNVQVNRLQRSVTYRLNEWQNEQWCDTLESLDSEDQSPWKLTKCVIRVPTPSPAMRVPGGLALSDSEKAEVLPDSLEAQFQPVNDPSEPAVIEMVMRRCGCTSMTPQVNRNYSVPRRSNWPSEVSRLARLRARIVYRTGY
jgi:hypothetical protein